MKLNVQYKFYFNAVYQKTPLIGDQGVKLSLLKQVNMVFPNNTSGGIGNSEVSNILVVKANASTGGTSLSTYNFTNVSNDVVSIRYIRAILLLNNSTTVGQNIKLGDSFSYTPWLGGTNVQEIIPPGGCVFRTCPNGVVWEMPQNGSNIFTVAAAAGTPEYELYIAGI